jgi:hypothetical protein
MLGRLLFNMLKFLSVADFTTLRPCGYPATTPTSNSNLMAMVGQKNQLYPSFLHKKRSSWSVIRRFFIPVKEE